MFIIGFFVGYLVGSLVCLIIETVCMSLDNEEEEDR